MTIKGLWIALLTVLMCNTLEAKVCQPCDGWGLSGDWLLWKLRRSDLDYCINGNFDLEETESNSPFGPIKCVEPDYDGGFRVALFRICECLDLGVEYTYYQTNKSSTTTNTEEVILATRIHPNDQTGLDLNSLNFANGDFDIELNVIDCVAGYRHQMGCSLLRPFAGLKFAWIDQNLKSTYSNSVTGESLDGVKVKDRIDMNTYMIFGGLGGSADLFCNIHLFGKFACALGLADIDTRHAQWEFDDGGVGVKYQNVKKQQHLIVSHCNAAIGVGFELCQYCCMDWSIKAGYEFHQWYGLPDFINFTSDQTRGAMARNKQNLGFDGLFVRLNAVF